MNAKRQAILTVAAELFHQHGIRRVSVEEICRRAECSKVTFYKHFNNKMDLAIEILDREINAMAEAQYAILDDSKRCFAEKFHAMMQLDRQQMHSIGSALMNDVFSGELPEVEAFMQRLIESHKERMTAFFFRGPGSGLV